MEPVATLLIVFLSIGLGLAGAVAVLELVFVIMAPPISADGHAVPRPRSIEASRQY
jgi:hypothetical protein